MDMIMWMCVNVYGCVWMCADVCVYVMCADLYGCVCVDMYGLILWVCMCVC